MRAPFPVIVLRQFLDRRTAKVTSFTPVGAPNTPLNQRRVITHAGRQLHPRQRTPLRHLHRQIVCRIVCGHSVL